MSSALPALLVALSVLAWAPRRGSDRLAVAVPEQPPPLSAAARERARRRRLLGPTTACALAGLAVVVLVGGAPGIGVGLLVGVCGPRVLQRLEPAADRAIRTRLAADLPAALDLLGACLSGGAAPDAAVRALAAAVPGPAGERFGQVAVALEVGSPPARAWARLAAEDPEGLASSAARVRWPAAPGGAPVAESVARLAAQARAETQHRGEQAAARAGVLAVAPLGLCFLPAFVLLGVVPVVIGLVGPVLTAL